MIHYILPLLILSAPTAMAQDACQVRGDTAEVIMLSRQTGTDVKELLKIAPDDEIRALILEAYQVPRYSTPERILREVADYREKHEVACYLTELFN